MSSENFIQEAHRLVGKEVEVITTEGTYRGTLLSVGSDSLVLETIISGRRIRMIIRIALIIALFRLIRGIF
jgi:small nuclear ribonucleoprotein (snRNP)-like protein